MRSREKYEAFLRVPGSFMLGIRVPGNDMVAEPAKPALSTQCIFAHAHAFAAILCL
jgi:hypothetical protein